MFLKRFFYFDKKKQFLFTKQRFYIFLSLLASNTYLFFASSNLFQLLLFWILEGIVIFIFSYFDIFKNSANFNITRFQKIFLIGDFAFLLGALILFRYAVLQEGYISSSSLDFDELNVLISYTYGISDSIELKLGVLGFSVAFLTRLFIFPFSCCAAFFANSSNIFFLSSVGVTYSLSGLFLFAKIFPLIELFDNFPNYLIGLFIISVLSSLIFLLFEKNIKIIFGYLISILNSIFIPTYLILRGFVKEESLVYSYFAILFIL